MNTCEQPHLDPTALPAARLMNDRRWCAGRWRTPEAIAQRSGMDRVWREANKEKVRASNFLHNTRRKLTGEQRAYNREWSKTPRGWAKKVLNSARRSSKDRNHSAPTVTVDELLAMLQATKDPTGRYICPASGIEMTLGTGKHRKLDTPSPDRLLGEVGYDRNNIALVAWHVNHDRNHRTMYNYAVACEYNALALESNVAAEPSDLTSWYRRASFYGRLDGVADFEDENK